MIKVDQWAESRRLHFADNLGEGDREARGGLQQPGELGLEDDRTGVGVVA